MSAHDARRRDKGVAGTARVADRAGQQGEALLPWGIPATGTGLPAAVWYTSELARCLDESPWPGWTQPGIDAHFPPTCSSSKLGAGCCCPVLVKHQL